MAPGKHNSQSRTQVGLAERLPLRSERMGLRGGRHRHYTEAERLAARTTKTEDCWLVSGYRVGGGGYPQILRDPDAQGNRKIELAHRLAYELAYGPIPAGHVVMHSCDNGVCVNPAHLSIGTQADNIHDCIRKSRRNAFGRQKLHPADIHIIRELLAQGLRQKDIAARFGVARNTICGIASGASWGWLPEQPRQVGAFGAQHAQGSFDLTHGAADVSGTDVR